MTKIRLQSISLQNFKGTRILTLNMLGKNTEISGMNGSGKTTIYRAYYWCLTGKTLEANENIQMLDKNNQIIHKLTTAVTVTLMIDDKYEVVLERRLTEDWKALGQPNEELKGTSQQRYFNEIPLSATEFDAKLSTICNIKKLLLLSDITKFMTLKNDERRKILMSIAGDINEEELMKDYPCISKAAAENKSVDELKKQTLSTKKRTAEELDVIPSQISAQDALKSNEDFEALKKERSDLDTMIQDLNNQLQGSTEELQIVKEHNEKVHAIEERLTQRKLEWSKEFRTKDVDIRAKVSNANTEYINAMSVKQKHEVEQAGRIEKKSKLLEEFDEKRTKWMEVNEQVFNSQETDSCPYCGHVFTEDEKSLRLNHSIEMFNRDKSERLSALQIEAVRLNEQIKVLSASINEYVKIIKPSDENFVKAKETAFNDAKAEQESLMKASVTDDKKYNEILKELNMARINGPKLAPKNNFEVMQKKRELEARRDEVLLLLGGESQNAKIEESKLQLNKRAEVCAQIIADCDKTLYEIQEYCKAKVNAVENKVNAFFSIVRWKFFKKNVTNDDLQEVCICHHNGVDFNSTNEADRINMAVDIIAGLSKAMGICAPIFIDGAESVNKILETENQQISLRVTSGDFKMETK